MANRNLAAAKRAKNDEFYTRLQDVEAQLIHYRPYFKNKTVFLNCDDPTYSAFWRHFHKLFAVYGLKKLQDVEAQLIHYRPYFKNKTVFLNCDDPTYSAFWRHFHKLFAVYGLKKLIATHYEYDENVHSYAMVYEGGSDSDALTGTRIELDGNGDFRSDECVEFLKESDIVVTNPPFSLFREYVAQLMEYDKKFLIIGSKNALTYKEIFPLIQSDSMWLGPQFPGGNAYFYVKPEFVREYALGVYDDTEHMVKFRNVSWFTNVSGWQCIFLCETGICTRICIRCV